MIQNNHDGTIYSYLEGDMRIFIKSVQLISINGQKPDEEQIIYQNEFQGWQVMRRVHQVEEVCNNGVVIKIEGYLMFKRTMPENRVREIMQTQREKYYLFA